MLNGCTGWPESFSQNYRERGFWRGETLAELPKRWAAAFGESVAIVHKNSRITYDELNRRVDRMAAGFRNHGIGAGERVVVQLPNLPEFVIVCFALFKIDAKPVFALIPHRASEIRHLCSLAAATAYVVPDAYRGFDHVQLAVEMLAETPSMRRVFVVGGSLPASAKPYLDEVVLLAEVDDAPQSMPVPDPTDVAFFLLSGGTTALPKLIPRTHDDYTYQTRACAELIGLTAKDVYLTALPVEFNFAWGCPGVVGTLRSGGTVVLVDEPLPHDCFDAIEKEGVTFTSLVPTLLQMWLENIDEAGDLRSLRLLQVGGARLHRDLAEQVMPAFECALQQVFGMAEGLLTFSRSSDSLEAMLTTQGRPLSPGDEIRVVGGAGAEVPPGNIGELLTRGPYTLRGYYQAPDHNAKAFTADGFYRTGDLVRLTDSGDLVVEGRIKDVINRGGNKVSAEEIEGHLLATPGIDRAAVVAVPDPYLGEAICAYVHCVGEPPDSSIRPAGAPS